MNFATPIFKKAVEDLKALCGTHEQLFRYGQFYVTRRTMDDLLGQITVELSANLRFAGAPDQLANAIAFFTAKLTKVAATDVDVVSIMNMLNLIELNGDMAAIRAMFGPTKQDEAHARSDFSDVWSNDNISAAPMLSSSPASLGKAQAAAKLERDRCWQVLRAFAAKLLKKRGGARLTPTVILSEGAVAGASPKETAPGAPASPGVAEILARQTFVYAQPSTLSAAAKRMRDALDAGGSHCGVLSGALHDHSVFPKPEHHILVFAHDTVDGQDAFLFWDPDAAHSNISGTGWGDGFGVLFSRDGRLCTGVDDADLADVERTKGVKAKGNHLRDILRHSYQVYTLETLPLPARMKLHVKVLSPPARASVDEMLDRAVAFFGSNGLELIELSRETIETPGTDFDRFQMLFVGADPHEATRRQRSAYDPASAPGFRRDARGHGIDNRFRRLDGAGA